MAYPIKDVTYLYTPTYRIDLPGHTAVSFSGPDALTRAEAYVSELEKGDCSRADDDAPAQSQ